MARAEDIGTRRKIITIAPNARRLSKCDKKLCRIPRRFVTSIPPLYLVLRYSFIDESRQVSRCFIVIQKRSSKLSTLANSVVLLGGANKDFRICEAINDLRPSPSHYQRTAFAAPIRMKTNSTENLGPEIEPFVRPGELPPRPENPEAEPDREPMPDIAPRRHAPEIEPVSPPQIEPEKSPQIEPYPSEFPAESPAESPSA